jgi:tRNA nucleotidyltransferase (CCA-adding enzyme)
VEPGAGALVNVSVVAAKREVTVDEALGLARTRYATAVGVGEVWVLRDDLARGVTLGLGDQDAAALARPLPVVESATREVIVRRQLAAGAPIVIVREHRRPLGGVSLPMLRHRPVPGLGRGIAAQLPPERRALLDAVRSVAEGQRVRVFLTGGAVRDGLRGHASRPDVWRDLDVVVEGDGLRFARALAEALGVEPRAITEHARFLTASLAVPGGGRLDVATARSERYEIRGALPRVVPATIGQDLARRDFTVNALAVELGTEGLDGLDPFGGRHDLVRRSLRTLHPLSFVEDPTRIFRAARYAVRLGFSLDRWTARTQALALGLAPYPGLSGSRLAAELTLILGEACPELVLRRLGASGAFRLIDPRFRFQRATAARLSALAATRRWAEQHGLRVTSLELAVLALLIDQAPPVREASLGRLGLTGEPAARLGRALAAMPPAMAGRPSDRARGLTGRDDLQLIALWLSGGARTRAAVEWFVGQARAVRPVLRGDEVVALGVGPGPQVAEVLGGLRDARLDGAVGDRDAETAYVRDWVARRRKEG